MDEIKKWLPVLYTILIIIAVFIAYQYFKKVKTGAAAAADTAAELTIYKTIATRLDMTLNEVINAHAIAVEIGRELETSKTMTAIDKVLHIVYDSVLVDVMNKSTSEKQTLLISSFYKEEVTAGRKLYEDLKAEINFNSTLEGIKFISLIK